jgi:zinc and cadmium transporter
MKTPLLTVLWVSLFGDILVFLASIVFLTNKKLIHGLASYATPFAAGALLAAAFVDFLHEAVERYEPIQVMVAALVGVLGFFLLEGWLHWFHHHSQEPFETVHTHETETEPIAVLAIAGNWLHNFIDGAAIAAAFLINPSAGIVTTMAVALHEIPREVGDSGYLLQRGVSRRGVIGVHGVAIIVTAIGTVTFYLAGATNPTFLAWLLGTTAGFFIYIAASDIIPNIRATRASKKTAIGLESLLVITGAVLVSIVIILAHHHIKS